MTPEKQRIAIAEACGWKHIKRLQSGWHGWIEPGPLEELPDYLNDLNAMHEAEEMCLPSKPCDYTRWEEYDNRLFNLCGGFASAHATAAQRAEAFLRTLGKWEESA